MNAGEGGKEQKGDYKIKRKFERYKSQCWTGHKLSLKLMCVCVCV